MNLSIFSLKSHFSATIVKMLHSLENRQINLNIRIIIIFKFCDFWLERA